MTEGRKALLLIFVFFIFMGGFYLYKTAGFNKELKRLNEEIAKEQGLLQKIQQEMTGIKREPKIDDVAKYAEALPAEIGNAQILQFFHQVAMKNKIEILTLDFEDHQQYEENKQMNHNDSSNDKKNNRNPSQTTDSGVKTVKINLTVRGDYNQLRNFVQDIYQSTRIFHLANWQWSVSGNSPVVQMVYKTYYFPQLEKELPRLKPIPTYEPANRNNPT
ncbi:hypothetical protein [Tepidibacillus fermentans]|uniref:Type IV pilus assembly protein PilO n=1 Tax=Tepidibacillus fermentans TaxID=1281767 RepID=A0A4R3K7V8_9BACI|nr:hypothetical protein [Tepidibacillus fermentans]TCS79054.1 hypothetical protein EDD72_12315 [Tepidibacillus fermentans]